jgi:hypothetical protein
VERYLGRFDFQYISLVRRRLFAHPVEMVSSGSGVFLHVLDTPYNRTNARQHSASTTVDCVATCSSQSRSLVVDRTISSSTNFAHQLSAFDAFGTLDWSVMSQQASELLTLSPHSKQSRTTPNYKSISQALEGSRQNEIEAVPYVSVVKSLINPTCRCCQPQASFPRQGNLQHKDRYVP